MNLASNVFRILKNEEKKYRLVFYSPKNDSIYHVGGKYRLMPSNRIYISCYDGKLFGTDIPKSHTKSWVYLGGL